MTGPAVPSLTLPKPTIGEIAREASVSTATVDRVLHNRGGVAAAKVAEVRRALDVLAGQTAESGRRTDLNFDVLLPLDAGPSTDRLAEVLVSLGRQRGAEVNLHWVPKMDPAALAEAMVRCERAGCSGVALMPLEHPLVREAADRLVARGIPLLTLTTELGGSQVFAHVGTDNRAAGRTAGYLMGRLTHDAGKVVVLWGGQLYRNHEQREMGFRSILRAEFPRLQLVEIDGGRDDAEGNYQEVSRLLAQHTDILGIYNVGGGNRGVARALKESGRAKAVVFIGHNLTAITQSLLLDGTMSVVVHQDIRKAAELAIEALIDRDGGRPVSIEVLPVEIIVKENIMGRASGWRHPPGRSQVGDLANTSA